MTRAGVVAYGAALAFGAAFAVALLSPGALLPADPLHMAYAGDEAESVIGQRYLLAAPWGWPLLLAPQLAAPGGTNVGLTDSIPLALLAAKLVRAWLPAGATVQAAWLALVLALQPAAAVYALRGANQRRAVPAAAIAVMSLSMPTLLVRYGHMALCSQAAILLAIGLYLRLVARPRLAGWVAPAVLAAGCLLVHPYIMAQVLAVLAAVPLTLLLRRDRRWLAAAAGFAVTVLGAAGLAALLGFGGTRPAPGFGFYSMNLLAPFTPAHSALFPDLAVDATGGQFFEGYQYLGAGLLLLAAVAATRPGWRRRLSRHAGLALVLGALTVFALSDRVFAGDRWLLDWGGVPAVLLQFRSTGRFFWPVAYTILVAAVAVVARPGGRAPGAAILLGAALLQWVDVAPLRASVARLSRHGADWAIDAATLGPVFAAHQRLVMWPPVACGDGAPDAVRVQALLLASQTALPTNTMFAARASGDADCDPATVGAGPQPGTLLLLTRPGDRWLVPDAGRQCRRSGPLTLCSADPASLAALAAMPDLTLPLGQELRPDDPKLLAGLGDGWSGPGDGVWTDAATATLHLQRPPGPALLTLRAVGFAPRRGGAQAVRLVVDGQPAADWTVPDGQQVLLQAALPATGHATTLTLHIAQPTSPAARDGAADPRTLGLLLRGLRLDPG